MSTRVEEWQQAQEAVQRWMEQERPYVFNKWGESRHELRLTRDDIHWDVGMYIHRAFVLGIDTPPGRQALLKAYSTLNSYVEAMVRLYGLAFEGGVPSGEIIPRA